MKEKIELTNDEERAVSPVIAVVLMIAVTVILGAIVAAFSLGMGSSAESTPQASFEYDYTNSTSTLNITHAGGDTLKADNVDVLVDGSSDGGSWGATPVSTGSQYKVSTSVTGGEEIRIKWIGEDGQTATLGTYEVPVT